MGSHLEASLGATMSQEVADILATMSGVFDESFRQLKSRLDELETNLGNLIK